MDAKTQDSPQPSPVEVVLQLSTGIWTTQALWAAASLGVADLLASGPKTRDELAHAAGAQPRALYRVLRALACLGVFAERSDGRFENTPQSEFLRSDVPGSVRDYIIFIGQPWHLGAFAHILHSVRTGEACGERAVGKPLWEFFATDAEQGRIFNAAMTGIIGDTAMAVRDAYDFSGIRTLVDVGGGHGILLATVLAANPSLHGVLFDQPHVVDGAGPTFSRLGVEDRTTIVGGDFFREVPKGDAYVMSHIIHDWDDEPSVKILRAIRRAAEPGARLLLVEAVIPAGNTFSFGKILDLEMLALPGGLERTESEYRALLAEGGFRLVRIVSTRSSSEIVQAVAT